MDPKDRKFLEKELNAFVNVGIMRTWKTGEMHHSFSIPASDVKAATGRERLHQAVINEYTSFMHQRFGVAASYDQGTAAFDVQVDLNDCKLSGDQSRDLLTAINVFHSS